MHPFCYLLCELCIYIFVISQYNCNTSKVVLYFSYILWNNLAFLSIKLSIYYKSSPSTSISAFLNSYILCFFPFRKMSFIQLPAFITNILFIWLNDYRFLLIHYLIVSFRVLSAEVFNLMAYTVLTSNGSISITIPS